MEVGQPKQSLLERAVEDVARAPPRHGDQRVTQRVQGAGESEAVRPDGELICRSAYDGHAVERCAPVRRLGDDQFKAWDVPTVQARRDWSADKASRRAIALEDPRLVEISATVSARYDDGSTNPHPRAEGNSGPDGSGGYPERPKRVGTEHAIVLTRQCGDRRVDFMTSHGRRLPGVGP